MTTFQVDDMTCSHCTSTLSTAIQAIDSAARVEFDLPRKLVAVESQALPADLAKAIQDAGYAPRQIHPEQTPSAARVARGCGCGCSSKKPQAIAMGRVTVPAVGACCS